MTLDLDTFLVALYTIVDDVYQAQVAPQLPVGVGLGVRDGAQAAAVAGYADAVIVGSALVSQLLDAPDEAAGLAGVRALAADLAAGVRAV